MKSVISRIRSFLDSKHRRGCFCLLVEKSTEVDFSTISELCKMKERILVYLLFIASIIGIIQWLFLNVNSLLQDNHSVQTVLFFSFQKQLNMILNGNNKHHSVARPFSPHLDSDGKEVYSVITQSGKCNLCFIFIIQMFYVIYPRMEDL